MTLLKKTGLGLICTCWNCKFILIGHTSDNQLNQYKLYYPPVGEYSSYTVSVNPDGSYTIDYKGHDPTVLDNETYVDTSNGIFGVGGRTVTTRNNQYVPGSSFGEVDEEGKNGARSEECIKAEGGGESNGGWWELVSLRVFHLWFLEFLTLVG